MGWAVCKSKEHDQGFKQSLCFAYVQMSQSIPTGCSNHGDPCTALSYAGKEGQRTVEEGAKMVSFDNNRSLCVIDATNFTR